MKVLLIRVPHRHMVTSGLPRSVENATGMYPPLGLLHLASAARAWAGAEVSLLDAHALDLDQDGIAAHVAAAAPDVVGIQVLTFNLVDAVLTARTVRRVRPTAHVCVGGPHAYLYPAETLAIEGVDSLVVGEAERTFAALLNALDNGGDPADVPGVAVRRNADVIGVEAPPLEQDLDALPPPARDLLDTARYWSILADRNPASTLISTRGCPMRCIYCDRPHLGKHYRAHGAAYVADDMEACVAGGARELFFYDDTFSLNRKRVLDICDEIIRRGIRIPWDVRTRADVIDADMLAAMKGAGVARVQIGVESGSRRVLQAMRKGITPEQAHDALAMCRRHRITSLAYFMLGNPGETEADVDETMRFIRTCAADHAHIGITLPYPGTDLYRLGLERGLYDHDYWRAFAAEPDEHFHPPSWTETFSQEALEAMRRRAYRLFYGRPRRIVRELLAVRTFRQGWRKATVGLGLLFSR